ncbi:MAG: peptidoglycan DD-metalloendopeptidase family protein [Gammaproteobacteria bacterium]|nr:peptidoglycan DD-metalloendopeptidase family protein [Gammaproteobacteria bacterium]
MRSGERQPVAPHAIRRAGILLLACLTFGCTSTLVDYSTSVHIVQPGETLYSIAWRHRVNHNDLARWNGLSDPDVIFVGQRLQLRPGAPAAASPSAQPSVQPSARPLPELPQVPPPRWLWPTRGPLLRAFGASEGLVNGIGIGGEAGQEISAAAAGRVVYAGSGLQAYGALVIINHNDSFLSAYGYNERLLVSQGQDVRAGQAIATMGLGPQRHPQLHFEIRQNGTPVDPLRHLPR